MSVPYGIPQGNCEFKEGEHVIRGITTAAEGFDSGWDIRGVDLFGVFYCPGCSTQVVIVGSWIEVQTPNI